MKLPIMLLLSEFFSFQCIGNRKLLPLNFTHPSYNFAGFISMSKRNLKSVGQSQCSNCRGGWGVEPPYLIFPTPLPLLKILPRGGRGSTPPPQFFLRVCSCFFPLP